MKFDEAINFIAENTVPVAAEMARPKNPEFQKWKEENPGVPTYKFFKMQRDLKKGTPAATPSDVPAAADVAATVAPEEPAGAQKYKELPDTLRTKEAVANYLAHNPEASYDEVITAIEPQSTEETPLNLDPEVVKSAMTAAGQGGGEISEPSAAELKKADLAAKYDRMRQALFRARGLKASPGRKATVKDMEPGEEEDEYGSAGRGINMRDEPIDPNEL